jgi:putative flippase GtrA
VPLRPWPLRFLAFLATGAANTIATYVLYLLLLRAGLGVATAYTLSFLAGIVLSALMNVGPVFGARPTARIILRYAAAYLAIWALGVGLVTAFERLGVPVQLAPLLALPLTVPAAWLLISRLLHS